MGETVAGSAAVRMEGIACPALVPICKAGLCGC